MRIITNGVKEILMSRIQCMRDINTILDDSIDALLARRNDCCSPSVSSSSSSSSHSSSSGPVIEMRWSDDQTVQWSNNEIVTY